VLINGTVDFFADNAHKGDTAGMRPVCALHEQPEVIQFIREFARHPHGLSKVRFSPVERGSKKGATCTTLKAGINEHIFYVSVIAKGPDVKKEFH